MLVAHAFNSRYNTKKYGLYGSIRDFTMYGNVQIPLPLNCSDTMPRISVSGLLSVEHPILTPEKPDAGLRPTQSRCIPSK